LKNLIIQDTLKYTQALGDGNENGMASDASCRAFGIR